MKPITEMTVAEIDAEIVWRAWKVAAVAGVEAVVKPPSLSLDTCIAAMEAGGLDASEITTHFVRMSVDDGDIAGTKRKFARRVLADLRAVQGAQP